MLAASTCELTLSVRLTNADLLADKSTAGAAHTCVLLVGDDDNCLVYKARLRYSPIRVNLPLGGGFIGGGGGGVCGPPPQGL